MEEKILKTRKGNLFYRKTGKGEPLLFLHGNGEDSSIFRAQFPFFKKHFTVYALDTRGHGQSALGVKRLTFRQIAKDILLLLDAEKVENVHIIGFSDGGNFGLYLASHHPERVASLITMGANYEADGLIDDCYGETIATQESLLALPDSDPDKIRRLCINSLMLDELDLTERDLRRIKTKTLIMAGEFDLVTDEQTEKIHRLVPGSRKIIVPGGGHDFFVSDPAALKKAAIAFYDFL
ncbi:alpha/beta hydrolase fold-1 [Trichococcus palustris]|uniref:Alpha/beta hydrolase fold-1 n=1 Tax=Trichococcus palustris TaxID=140314 RepID=A0A143Y7U3_9LACT|nr:alpha/beta hydrolase [Trichococcus palustris]CZQ80254.1 alpha/beta hydrolase fold-1 [Trichococcus palustris]SFK64954.1 Pimeloyl-ACP methyl ester carboxylesterase [Trichococcus palustris]